MAASRRSFFQQHRSAHALKNVGYRPAAAQRPEAPNACARAACGPGGSERMWGQSPIWDPFLGWPRAVFASSAKKDLAATKEVVGRPPISRPIGRTSFRGAASIAHGAPRVAHGAKAGARYAIRAFRAQCGRPRM
eukprot:6908915-Alexandrium_andersonii.AAC.1